MLTQQNIHLVDKVKQLSEECQKLQGEADACKTASNKLKAYYRALYELIKASFLKVIASDINRAHNEELTELKIDPDQVEFTHIKLITEKLVSLIGNKRGIASTYDSNMILTKLSNYSLLQEETEKLKNKNIANEEQIKKQSIEIKSLQKKVDGFVPYSSKEKEYFPVEMRSINLVDLKEYIMEAISTKYIEKKKETECIVFESDMKELQTKCKQLQIENEMLKKECSSKEQKIIDLESLLVRS